MHRRILIVSLVVIGLAFSGLALASPEKDQGAPVPWAPIGFTRAAETEPNNDCTTANGPIVFDDSWDGFIDADDQDWYVYDGSYGDCLELETHPLNGSTTDTRLYIYANDCVTQLDYNDDGGTSFFSKIEAFMVPSDDPIYIVVTGYSATTTGEYTLTLIEGTGCVVPPDPPENNTCETAIELCGDFDFTYTTEGATNDYSPGAGGCTGYSANGMDIVYTICLPEGGSMWASIVDDDYDTSLYLITDCADPVGSCVAGGDDPEDITFTGPGGIYYLIVDGYSTDSSGNGRLVGTTDCCDPTPTIESSWGQIKSIFR